jgi:hypothetical protein
MDVRVHQLRALVAVVDAGTFTDAATVLGVSQAAVSRSVAALERSLVSGLAFCFPPRVGTAPGCCSGPPGTSR